MLGRANPRIQQSVPHRSARQVWSNRPPAQKIFTRHAKLLEHSDRTPVVDITSRLNALHRFQRHKPVEDGSRRLGGVPLAPVMTRQNKPQLSTVTLNATRNPTYGRVIGPHSEPPGKLLAGLPTPHGAFGCLDCSLHVYEGGPIHIASHFGITTVVEHRRRIGLLRAA